MIASLTGLLALLLQTVGVGSPLLTMNTQSAAPNAAPATEAICPATTAIQATCLSRVRALSGHQFKAAATAKALPSGYGPTQFRTAYNVTTSGAVSLAVITAYDNPRLASDLATYDQAFGLPAFPSCASASQTGCFAKLGQTGATTRLPVTNRNWAVEADLDVELAHAMCPSCRLTIVEANNANIPNLLAAVDQAVALGAHVVSMSWGTGEFLSETSYDSHFANPHVNFVAASGDSGYGAGWPSASGRVLSAGGTHLALNTNNTRTSETTWSGTGSGCSRYEAKPAWQTDTGCTRRTSNDLAADADPATGAAIYAGYSPYGSGWLTVGGTSLATPLLAAMIADAPAVSQTTLLSDLYAAPSSTSLYDVVSGTNGHCSPPYLCTAGTGYDGPTGLGAPMGLGAL